MVSLDSVVLTFEQSLLHDFSLFIGSPVALTYMIVEAEGLPQESSNRGRVRQEMGYGVGDV